MPILREILDLNAETPMNLQTEKPPRFIAFPHLPDRNPASLATTHHRPSPEAPIVTEVHSRRPYVCCNQRGKGVSGLDQRNLPRDVGVKALSRSIRRNRETNAC